MHYLIKLKITFQNFKLSTKQFCLYLLTKNGSGHTDFERFRCLKKEMIFF